MVKNKDSVQEEAFKAVKDYNRSSIVASMGVGKTKLGLKFLEHNYSPLMKVLIVAPKISIFDTWIEELLKFNLNYLESSITFSTYLSLHKQSSEFDVVILDEMHNLVPESSEEWLSNYKGKILGLTGTPPSSRSEKGRLVLRYCPIKYTYTTDEAIDDKILNDYKIIVHSLKLDTNKNIKKVLKNGGTWMTSEQSEYDYWEGRINKATNDKEKMLFRILRMKSIMGFTTKEKYAQKLFLNTKNKVIIFANTTDQADRLCKDSYHSKNPLSEENLTNFKEGIITKLSAVQQLSEGVNITGLKEGIILHTFSGDSPKARQKLGRCLRLAIDEVATIHVLRFVNTIDATWCNSVLEHFDSTKITYL